MDPIELEIDTPPVSWKAHGGYGRRAFNPRQAEKEYYQLQIKKQYHKNAPLTVAVKIDYTFFMPIPASASKKMKEKMAGGRVNHVKRPDVSNITKFTEDTLKGIAIQDDSQVVECRARKFYSEKPRTIIKIELA